MQTLCIVEPEKRVNLSTELILHRTFVPMCRSGPTSEASVIKLAIDLGADVEAMTDVPADYQAWREEVRVATSTIRVLSDPRAMAVQELRVDKAKVRAFLNGEFSKDWTIMADILETVEPWKTYVHHYRKAVLSDIVNGPLIKTAEDTVMSDNLAKMQETLNCALTWVEQGRPLGLRTLEQKLINRFKELLAFYETHVGTAALSKVTIRSY